MSHYKDDDNKEVPIEAIEYAQKLIQKYKLVK